MHHLIAKFFNGCPLPAMVCFMMLVIPTMALAEKSMTVIPLNNADAEELVTAIEAQLSEDSSVSIYQNQIILNATAEETAKIKMLMVTLDTPAKQLLIAVKNNSQGSITTTQGGFSNNNSGTPGIKINRHGLNTETTTTTIEHRSVKNSGSGQQGIRASEGYPSFITTGSAKAYSQPLYNSNGQIVQNQEWHNAQTGFYATAWVNGNNVSIKIEQQKQRFNNDSSMDNQQLQTQVNGRLGEWIAIGSLNSQETINTRQLNSMGRSKDTQDNTIYLKVELAE